jgi:hypothetical protein
MIIDTTRKFSKPRHLHRTAFDAVQVRGVISFQMNYVIPTGFGDSALQFYNPFIPTGLLTAHG